MAKTGAPVGVAADVNDIPWAAAAGGMQKINITDMGRSPERMAVITAGG